MSRGEYQEKPPLPITLGMEVAGTVTQTGPGVTGLRVGDRVAAVPGSGGLAEQCCVQAARCVLLPDTMTDVDAAAFQIAYGTSHLALTRRAQLQPGERLLVLGAAGGVGLTAVELGARMGARVIACARGAQKLAIATAAGAHEVIDSDTPDLKAVLKAMGGVDVVYDAVGDPLFSAALRACKPGARLLVIGFAAGKVPQIPANYLLVKNLTVHGLYWGGYLGFAPEILTASLTELFQWHAQGDLHPHVSHVLSLDRAAEGMEMLRNRTSTGKVVIVP
jgi:NADPH2:quinone reductase